MSLSLLKRSLQIVEEDIELDDCKGKKKAKNVRRPREATKGRGSIIDLIPQNQRLVAFERDHKTKTKKRVNQIKETAKVTIKQAQNRMQRSEKRADENVQRLLQLNHSTKLKNDTVELMLRRARTGHYVIPEQRPKDESESVFTAEDFAKFEKEYFVS